jgi:hypothetical protein
LPSSGEKKKPFKLLLIIFSENILTFQKLTDLTAKLLLALASKVILDPESHRTHDHSLPSDGSGSITLCFNH